MLTISSSTSFFQVGQFSGSRGDSLGCGTSTMSLFLPLACFSRDVSRPERVIRACQEIMEAEPTVVAMLPSIHHVGQQCRPGHMLEMLVV